ncbi:MAG TPA: hypothetical protein ENJ18_01460 [Nannocystis exedens]|nr:hypothetical protein [Nannocystis exedens]
MAFAKNSRYAATPTVTVEIETGRTVTVLKLRRPPMSEGRQVAIRDGDRLDLLALRHLGDPTAHWRIADANAELDGADLWREIGRVITIPED